MFTKEEARACVTLMHLALAEDLADKGDVTSQALLPADLVGQAVFIARSPGVLAGLPAVSLTLLGVNEKVKLTPLVAEGATLSPGQQIALLAGPMRSMLTAERTALNFLQHLSGVASLTRKYVDQVADLPVKILDTRKTLPGWRLLEKYAVRCGGGHNHRLGLYDGVLIKDNHLAALGSSLASLPRAVQLARQYHVRSLPIEIEVDSLEQLEAVLPCQPEIVLLDNMTPEQLRRAVQRKNEIAPNVLLEASGGVTLQTLRAIAETGVERISIGALTHSAPALDIALDYVSR